MGKKTATITLFIEPELKQMMSDIAWQERTNLSELIRRVCAEYIKHQGVKDVSSDL
jgi:hypothetical protein